MSYTRVVVAVIDKDVRSIEPRALSVLQRILIGSGFITRSIGRHVALRHNNTTYPVMEPIVMFNFLNPFCFFFNQNVNSKIGQMMRGTKQDRIDNTTQTRERILACNCRYKEYDTLLPYTCVGLDALFLRSYGPHKADKRYGQVDTPHNGEIPVQP